MPEERLQKILAAGGLGSRRACEEIIAAGRVRVNGEVTDAPGTKADPDVDTITVDGEKIEPAPRVYIMLNKPAGCLCAARDHRGRKTVFDFVGDAPARVFHVGRLDYDTEGLLLLTNDGEFSQKVTHPGHKVFKTYLALVRGVPSEAALDRLRRGLELDDGPTSPAEAALIDKTVVRETKRNKKGRANIVKAARVELKIREGRKRQVKRMFREVGHPVIALSRVAIGQLRLDGLEPGRWRLLAKTEAELALSND